MCFNFEDAYICCSVYILSYLVFNFNFPINNFLQPLSNNKSSLDLRQFKDTHVQVDILASLDLLVHSCMS